MVEVAELVDYGVLLEVWQSAVIATHPSNGDFWDCLAEAKDKLVENVPRNQELVDDQCCGFPFRVVL